MNIALMTASLPIDNETFIEIKDLSEYGMTVDFCYYHAALNLSLLQKTYSIGFCILAYDEMTNKLVGVISAVDKIGLNTYEWSMLIDPMYREAGIDEALLSVLSTALKERGAIGELVALLENDYYGRRTIERYGYTYSFSEATFEAEAEKLSKCCMDNQIFIRPYAETTDLEAMVEIFRETFGDLREETLELLEINSKELGRVIWVAEVEGNVVGTLTSLKEGDAQCVTSLAVHPKWQRKGIATALLHWIKDFAYRNGEQIVKLDVEIENEHALSVYHKAGFYKSMQIDYYAYGGI